MRRSSTTSRQSTLPLRVQDTNRAGMATPQTKDRLGLGKLSMSKPNSGTSERKTSFFGKRASGTRVSQFGASEKIKDPRPLHDKAYIQQCIRQLCEFLNENGYAQVLTVKSLQGPSTKDFLKIFAFIYSFICPNYEIPDSKFEEEIPRVFRELGYPFSLSKSSMYTVGAPHTWPQIVAALVWLIDCVKLTHAIEQQDVAFEEPQLGVPSENGIDFNPLFLDFTTKCYNRYMDGHDTFEDLETEVFVRLKNMYSVDESHVESRLAEARRLSEEVEKLEKEKEREPDRLSSMRKLKASLQTDIQKYQKYLTEMESHSTLMDQRVHSLGEELESTGLEFEAVKQENLKLKNILDNQECSVADIERIKYEENELKETITKLTKELDNDKQLLWSEELKYAKIKEAVETQTAEFHKLARKLRQNPSTAEITSGYDFKLECNLESEQSLQSCRNKVNLRLLEMEAQSEALITTGNNEKMDMQEMNEQLTSMKTERKNDVKNLKDEVQRLDDLLQQKNQELEEQETGWAAELQSLEKHRQVLESGVTKGLDEAMKELQKAQQELQLVEHQTEEENRQVGNKLYRVVSAVAAHMETIEKHIEDKRLKTEREYEEFKQQDLLADLREVIERYKQKAELLQSPSHQ